MKGSLTDSETIRSLLTRHGFHFSKALGQNFLIDAYEPIFKLVKYFVEKYE